MVKTLVIVNTLVKANNLAKANTQNTANRVKTLVVVLILCHALVPTRKIIMVNSDGSKIIDIVS